MVTCVADFLSNPVGARTDQLCHQWHDQTVTVFLRLSRPVDGVILANHVRRSFLAVLSKGASRAARLNAPCTWHPPCTFDIFKREQMRFRSDGLPKPYTIAILVHDTIAEVRLRVFGIAGERFSSASDALVQALADFLPWQKRLRMSPPEILKRIHDQTSGLTLGDVGAHARIKIHTPVDISNRNTKHNIARSLLGRGLRRLDGIARWNGVFLEPSETQNITNQFDHLSYDVTQLVVTQHHSQNRHDKKRSFDVCLGEIEITGNLAPLLPVFRLIERCQIGRGCVQGLGVIEFITH